MANVIPGQLVVCVNSNALEGEISAFKKMAAFHLKKVVADETFVEKIVAKAKIVKVSSMTDIVKKGDQIKEYPTSPFKLVIDHNSKVPFTIREEGTRIGLRFESNLVKLGLLKPIVVKKEIKEQKSYASSDLTFISDRDKKSLVRLSKLDYVAEKLSQWKQTTRELLIQGKYIWQREDGTWEKVSKYEAIKFLGEEYPSIAPYCVTLPEVDSAIMMFIVEKVGENGKYYVQDFCKLWNVGLTHTGQPGEEIDPEAADQLLIDLEAAAARRK